MDQETELARARDILVLTSAKVGARARVKTGVILELAQGYPRVVEHQTDLNHQIY